MMTFRQLLLKNSLGNFHKYSSYFLSCTFTVFIFYLFSAFIFHPNVKLGENIHGIVTVLLMGCLVVIVFFTVIFVWYSNSTFMKSRKKEFGLLKLIGLENKQIARLIFFEFSMISILAIVIGILFGMLMTKLFFMGINVILKPIIPLTFAVPIDALVLTVGVFLLLFELITLLGLREIQKSETIHLIKAAKKPKEPPVYSRFLVAIALMLLMAGYALAAISNLVLLFFAIIPILVFVIIGTYLLFMQVTTAVLSKLQQRSTLYWKKTNMTTISNLIYKLKDNARILSIVSILSAVVTSSMGLLLWFSDSSSTTIRGPQDLLIVQQGLEDEPVYTENEIRSYAQTYEMDVHAVDETVILPSTVLLDQREHTMWIMSVSDYNQRAERMESVQPLTVAEDDAVFIAPFVQGEGDVYRPPTYEDDEMLIPLAKGEKLVKVIDSLYEVAIIRGKPLGEKYLLVVSDDHFQEWKKDYPQEKALVLHEYYFGDLTHGKEFYAALQQEKPEATDVMYEGFMTYLDVHTANQLLLFIGLFIALLFFLANGSLIYFKLFTELEDDRQMFLILRKVGMSDQEIRRVLTIQLAILFFLPVLVGTIHTLFAFNSARAALFASTVWQTGSFAIVLYFLFQLIYFLLARTVYTKKVLRS
ncbi:FtsX-like permease family protein [Halalkalibacterium halodurans]|nr:FtsX-like permease family protein [Halalkalibacterium halodurans]MED4080378.1 FtsX-like permease family protein [Halalkalibacterium halodurans]MED4084558.1 FtsX-like permease family protein [Halalkalibacterium halodurans]MED4104878.1 FtsX-like permease family protein [Halalkalibacterium halodurans]MED4109681.1 FtsX-like permease family protein [Halalkalibacterium halodurans]MED4147974.1 FtsX-like permease family protein [Halalkalibacterium halodurans]